MSTITNTVPEILEESRIKFNLSDVESSMNYHDLNKEEKAIIRNENLVPTS